MALVVIEFKDDGDEVIITCECDGKDIDENQVCDDDTQAIRMVKDVLKFIESKGHDFH